MVEEGVRGVGEVVTGNEIETKALRLLREVNQRQARDVAGARVRPYLCAHVVGLDTNTQYYEEALDLLVEGGALLRHETERRAFRITERGVDMAQQTEHKEPPGIPEAAAGEAASRGEEPFPHEEERPEEGLERPWWRRILGG